MNNSSQFINTQSKKNYNHFIAQYNITNYLRKNSHFITMEMLAVSLYQPGQVTEQCKGDNQSS